MDVAALKAQLIRDEGMRLKPYVDTVGKATVGCGRNLSDVGISATEAEFMLLNDIQSVLSMLNLNVPWWSTLSGNRQLVLANMAFNMGVTGLLGFKKMLAACRAGNYDEAAAEMENSLWRQQVGDRALRLSKLMRDG